jgi:hypothetical protein
MLGRALLQEAGCYQAAHARLQMYAHGWLCTDCMFTLIHACMEKAMLHAGVSAQLEGRRSRARARAAAAGSIIYADQPALIRARGHVEYTSSPTLSGEPDSPGLKHRLLL